MEIHLGSCGWSFPDWKGTFYPKGTKDELACYAHQYRAVEIDSTFYRMPTAHVIELWNQKTPSGFIFCPKFSRRITHLHQLQGADDLVSYFLSVVSKLGEKLGPIVIELPPTFTYEQLPTLEIFLRDLPTEIRFAVEFRHRSWVGKSKALGLLRALKIGLVMAEHPKYPRFTEATTDFAYLRLMGPYQAFPNYAQLQRSQEEVLRAWAEVLTDMTPQVPRAFVFISNHLEGHSPASIERFRAMLAKQGTGLKEAA